MIFRASIVSKVLETVCYRAMPLRVACLLCPLPCSTPLEGSNLAGVPRPDSAGGSREAGKQQEKNSQRPPPANFFLVLPKGARSPARVASRPVPATLGGKSSLLS